MGCDIHIRAEVRKDGKWNLVAEPKFENPFYDPETEAKYGKDDSSGYWKKMCVDPYRGRNYDLFAFLANVRNDGLITPLSEPRGVPKDISDDGRAFMGDDGESVDGHSHSYFTLKELLEVDWNQKIGQTGWITIKQYKELKAGKLPDSWSGGVFGHGIRHLKPDEADAHIKAGTEQEGDDKNWQAPRDYVSATWHNTLKDVCGYFHNNTLPMLKDLGYPPEDIRIIFFFDN